MNGVLPLWKPKGMTSHDCVVRVRKLLGTRKVGHTGTLDPEVEGVLAICIGQATKVVPYLTDMQKTYLAECSLGIATDTEDAHGEIVEEKTVVKPPSKKDIESVLKSFRGEITQIPPMYSAVKVKGKKLYEYARANEYVDRPSRQVMIYGLTHKTTDENRYKKFMLHVNCSAGTYIRTLCVDIGKKLGYPSHMSDLIRLQASSFKSEETVTFRDIEDALKSNAAHHLLVPIESALKDWDRLYVNEENKNKMLHGQKLPLPEYKLNTDPFLVMYKTELLAIYQIHPNNSEQIKPVRVFVNEKV